MLEELLGLGHRPLGAPVIPCGGERASLMCEEQRHGARCCGGSAPFNGGAGEHNGTWDLAKAIGLVAHVRQDAGAHHTVTDAPNWKSSCMKNPAAVRIAATSRIPTRRVAGVSVGKPSGREPRQSGRVHMTVGQWRFVTRPPLVLRALMREGFQVAERLGQGTGVSGGACGHPRRHCSGEAQILRGDLPPEFVTQGFGHIPGGLTLNTATVQPPLNSDVRGTQAVAVPLSDFANSLRQPFV
ncbi:hypothetical protein [Streptomyces niveus]|uniref:hypothetical protein n=1 Tax=Streptomyces niveus TaxID=193462 RepID=UPI0033A05D96